MAIGYRAILSAEYNDTNLDRTVGLLREWVTQKKGFSSLPSRGDALTNASEATLVANEVSESDRGISGYRWTLTEAWTAPPWYKNTDTSRTGVTQVSLVFSEGKLWLWVDIEPPELRYLDKAGRERVEPQPSGTPTFVSEILREVEMQDGFERPASTLEIIANDFHIEHLLRVLRDDDRRGAVYVTSPPEGVTDADWLNRSGRILGRIEGMGFGYLLTTEARRAFNSVATKGHMIPAGSMRTFLPGVNLDDPKDSLRHRLLHASTIKESRDARLQRIIRNAQVARLRDVRLPTPLRDADYAFLRQKGQRTVEVLHNAAAIAAQKPNEGQTSDLLQSLAEAEELLTLALDENESLRTAMNLERRVAESLRAESEESYLDAASLRLGLEKGQREVDYLRRELQKLGADGASVAYGFVDESNVAEYPSTFHELVDRMDQLTGIRFFGDRDDVEDLDEYSDFGDVGVMRTWDALVTFNAYAQARSEGSFENSLSHYISNTQHGLPMRISNVKWSEGETVRSNPKMMAQRTVSGLPETIDPSGSKLLVSHVALATGRAGSPRLYFEDTFAVAGFVTVGYIGTHLDNTSTN